MRQPSSNPARAAESVPTAAARSGAARSVLSAYRAAGVATHARPYWHGDRLYALRGARPQPFVLDEEACSPVTVHHRLHLDHAPHAATPGGVCRARGGIVDEYGRGSGPDAACQDVQERARDETGEQATDAPPLPGR
ncbi:hypothetical protein GCM10010240_64200 [Streptomyces griseoviridis]|nr:hypothetical protein GCM10010240_64200 [Streptomyces griseoviridis]